MAHDVVCTCVMKPAEVLDMMEKRGEDMSLLNPDTGFYNMCGKCMDPCSLKWRPISKMGGGDMGGMSGGK